MSARKLSSLSLFVVALITTISAQQLPTYSAAFWSYAPTNGNDLYCHYGSDSATVYVDQIRISGASWNWYGDGGGGDWATYMRIALVRRAGRNGGGQTYSASSIQAQNDPLDPPSKSTFQNFGNAHYPPETNMAPSVQGIRVVDLRWGDNRDQEVLYQRLPDQKPLTLRGSNDGVCLYLDTYSPSNLWYLSIDETWREEASH